MKEQSSIIENPYNKENPRRTGIRLVKAVPGLYGEPGLTISSPVPVRLLQDGIYSEESEAEYYFFIEHSERRDKTPIRIAVEWPDAEIKSVVCEGSFVPFEVAGARIQFELDVNGFSGRSKTLDIHTHLNEPGLSIRVEQNHVLRNAGLYTSMPWPQVQIDSVVHQLFASREVLHALQVPSDLASQQLGYIALMGFETNNPAHFDYPPHWHLIFRWPHWAGSQAPHFYLDSDGKNIRNVVTIDGIPNAQSSYEPGEWCYMKDCFGHDFMAIQVCTDGGVAVTRPDTPVYVLAPLDGNGLAVKCGNEIIGTIRVSNDTSEGSMTIAWSLNEEFGSSADSFSRSYVERVKYDPLLGHVLQMSKQT